MPDPGRAGPDSATSRARSRPAFSGWPSCCAATAEEETRLVVLRVVRQRALERRLGSRGDDAVRLRHQRLAEIGLAIGARAIEAQRIAPRLHGIVEPLEPHVDRRRHLPAAAVSGFLLQMRFDLRNQPVERAVLQRRRVAAGERLPGNCGEPR
jgi:hypothetical protein